MFDKLSRKLKWGLNTIAIVIVTLFFVLFFISYYHMLSGDYQERMEMVGNRSVQNVKTNLRSIEEGMDMFMYRYDLSKLENDIPDELAANFFYNFVIYCPCNTAFVTMKDSGYFLPQNESGKYKNFVTNYNIDEILREKDSCWTYYDSPHDENNMVFLTKSIKDEKGKTVGFISAGIQGLNSVMERDTDREIFSDFLYFAFDSGEILSFDGERKEKELLRKVFNTKESYSDKNVNITYGDIGENGISVLSYSKKEYMKELFLKLAVVLILLYAFMIFLHIVFVRRLIAWIIRRLTVLCKDIDAYSEELNEKRV